VYGGAVEPARASRLAPDARRDQLIRKGIELVGQHGHEEMSITELARAAGISKGLLYHYFPTKSDFVVAIFRQAREDLEERIKTDDAALEPAQRLTASLSAFLDYAEEHAAGFQALVRARSGDDAAIRAELAHGRRRRIDQLVDVAAVRAGTDRASVESPALEAAIEGWLAFSETVVVRWLSDRKLQRVEVLHLLRNSLLAAIDSALEPIGVANP
jgi:AcrR family transcriptional regulator